MRVGNGNGQEASAKTDGVRRIDVATLLGSAREIILIHNDSEYRLRLTSSDKPQNAITVPPPLPAPRLAPQPPAPVAAQAPPDILNPYYRELSEHLEPYMRRAREQWQRGTSTVQCTINKHGRLVSLRVKESSRLENLDTNVLAILRQAEPLPPFPQGMTGDQLTLEFQVVFTLR